MICLSFFSLDGHLGCFQFGALMHKATINMIEQSLFVNIHMFYFILYTFRYLKMEVIGHWVGAYLTSQEIPRSIHKVDCPILQSH